MPAPPWRIPRRRSRRRRPLFRPGRARASLSATRSCARPPTRFWPARTNSVGCCRARRARRWPKASARRCAPARSSISSPANALRLAGETLPSVRPNIGVEITREPVGVVGIITPWNFPIAIPAWKIAPALATATPSSSSRPNWCPAAPGRSSTSSCAPACRRACLNLVMGKGSVVGQTMLDSPDVNAITFTGSTGTGKRVALRLHRA
jgi:acyl-CoA reductase-like NAD-dependent aldehyde dehydrogenase